MKVKLEMIENERENFNHRIKINKKNCGEWQYCTFDRFLGRTCSASRWISDRWRWSVRLLRRG